MKAAMELGNGKSPQPQIQRKGKKKEDVRLPFWAGNSRKRQPAEDSVKEISDEIGKIVTKMEQEMLERELKENADKMDLGEIHNGYRLRIIRPEPTLEQLHDRSNEKEGGCSCRKNGTVDCPAFGGTGKISERDGTGEKSLWEPDLPQGWQDF